MDASSAVSKFSGVGHIVIEVKDLLVRHAVPACCHTAQLQRFTSESVGSQLARAVWAALIRICAEDSETRMPVSRYDGGAWMQPL